QERGAPHRRRLLHLTCRGDERQCGARASKTRVPRRENSEGRSRELGQRRAAAREQGPGAAGGARLAAPPAREEVEVEVVDDLTTFRPAVDVNAIAALGEAL